MYIVYECGKGDVAIKHKALNIGRTRCGIEFYNEDATAFTPWADQHIFTEHELLLEKNCPKCYPRKGTPVRDLPEEPDGDPPHTREECNGGCDFHLTTLPAEAEEIEE